MEFNSFLWNNFKELTKGKELISFFHNYKTNIIDKKDITLYSDIRNLVAYKDTLEIDFEQYINEVSNFYSEIINVSNDDGIKTQLDNIDEAEEFYEYLSELVYVDQQQGKETSNSVFSVDDVPLLSEVLFSIFPEYYFPYYFERLYHDLIAIFDEFGIFLPSVPKKHDAGGRFNHYFEICKSLYDFRKQNGLNESEMPAFIYGFALNVINRYKINDILPAPRRAYFVGAGKKDSTIDSSGDFDYLDKATDKTISNWNGNPETQAGDIIVMYCLTPRSYIHSIWRAVTPGSYDPFFHFYKNIYIGNPIHVEPIQINEIKTDPILCKMPLVKGNMQGINGRNISKKYYDRIIEILQEKGQDISLLPKLTDDTIVIPELNSEKDVEEELLEPLLLKLGYKRHEWLRQMKLRMGRGDRVYPDYAILPNEERNNESCFWIWEAKYSIANHKQLEEDFGQAKFYALRLKSSGLGLVSKEGIWLSLPDYNIKKVKFWSWKQAGLRDCLNEIFDIAGNKK